jgi:hypothetical protein
VNFFDGHFNFFHKSWSGADGESNPVFFTPAPRDELGGALPPGAVLTHRRPCHKKSAGVRSYT